MKNLLVLSLMFSWAASAAQTFNGAGKKWKCFGVWQISSEVSMILGCPENIIAQVGEGTFEVRHLVRSTPVKCVYDEINTAIDVPGSRIISCDKPQD